MRTDEGSIDRVFHALSDGTRRTILERLSQGPASVSKLAEPLGMTLAATVQHLQVLEASGLIVTEKAGRVRTCKIEPKGIAIAKQWLEERRTTWERRLDNLQDLLGQE